MNEKCECTHNAIRCNNKYYKERGFLQHCSKEVDATITYYVYIHCEETRRELSTRESTCRKVVSWVHIFIIVCKKYDKDCVECNIA